MVFDEATSSLDSETEKLIQDCIDKTFVDNTRIIISHRLSSIQHADKIFVLKDGTFIQEGQHDELLSINGLYKKLYNKQMLKIGNES